MERPLRLAIKKQRIIRPAELLGVQYLENQDDVNSFLEGLRKEPGANVLPTYWSLLGWIDDDPDQPLALSRDSGHLILLSGCQGSGKTLFSTVVAEGTLCPGEPLASPSLLPAAYAFVHLDENDRLPQLLDALKENPVRADVDLLLQRLGVGPMPLLRVRLAVPHSLPTETWAWRWWNCASNSASWDSPAWKRCWGPRRAPAGCGACWTRPRPGGDGDGIALPTVLVGQGGMCRSPPTRPPTSPLYHR